MANDTTDTTKLLEFHSCNTPRGLLYYNIDSLTDTQQKELNEEKIGAAREAQQYLAGHPQVRAFISIITRLVMLERPRNNFHEIIAKYFAQSRDDIEADIEQYLTSRGLHKSGSDSNLGLFVSESTLLSVDAEAEETLDFQSKTYEISKKSRSGEVSVNEGNDISLTTGLHRYFLEMPVKHYSSEMFQAEGLDSDVLEFLGEFQESCPESDTIAIDLNENAESPRVTRIEIGEKVAEKITSRTKSSKVLFSDVVISTPSDEPRVSGTIYPDGSKMHQIYLAEEEDE